MLLKVLKKALRLFKTLTIIFIKKLKYKYTIIKKGFSYKHSLIKPSNFLFDLKSKGNLRSIVDIPKVFADADSICGRIINHLGLQKVCLGHSNNVA